MPRRYSKRFDLVPGSIPTIRQHYANTFGRPWPHDDSRLEQLWAESKPTGQPRFEYIILQMRAEHEFTPD